MLADNNAVNIIFGTGRYSKIGKGNCVQLDNNKMS